MKKYSVLILDDEAMNRQLLRIALESTYSASIYEASSNDEAWQILRHNRIDVITTDIIHPEENAIEFVREVRKDLQYAFTPILVISAVSWDHTSELSSLNVACFNKPVNISDVLRLVGMLLHMKKDPYISMLDMGTELPSLDYKREIDIHTNDGRAAIAKDIIAMANSGGGTIIVGVDEVAPGEFSKVGLPVKNLHDFEASVINRAVRNYMSPSVSLTVRRVIDNGLTFIFIEVPSIDDELVLVAKMNLKSGLYSGRIYIRTAASESAELQDAAELRRLTDRVIRHKISNLLKR